MKPRYHQNKPITRKLSGEGIGDEDYENAQKVWREFGMKTQGLPRLIQHV